MEGWIKLHRKILENPIVCKDADHLAVWVYLLLHATHEDYPALFKGKKIVLHPGQLITGRLKIAAELSVNESKVKRILSAFKNDQQIDQQASNKNSLITILHWNDYQKSDQQIDQQMTSKCPTDDQQMTTNKNERIEEQKKKNKNITREANELFERLWKLYPNPRGKGEVSAAKKRELLAIGESTLVKAIERYSLELQRDADWRRPKNGSTFFNSGYKDYLDENYIPLPEPKKPEAKNKFNNFEDRDYSRNELLDLEKQLLLGGANNGQGTCDTEKN